MQAITTGTTLLLTAIITFSAHAEMRTWTDLRGNTIQAEMLENMHGNVTLQMESGKETHIKISNLSADDQKYVIKNSPPKIDIQVSELTERENQGFSVPDRDDVSNERQLQIQTTFVEYKIKLNKSNSIPYDKPIHAEFYLIGFKKETEEYVLLDKTVALVDFNRDDSKNKFEFISDNVTVKNLQGGQEKGTELFGHLVVLVDDNNRVFAIDGSRGKIEEHAARIRKRKEGDSVKKADLASADNRLK